MKNKIILILVCASMFLILSCATVEPVTKAEAYSDLYAEKPVTVLIMPPINNSTNVDAKDYFYSTLNVPFCNAGYYVYPPFLTLSILQIESAYDSELFINKDLSKFNKLFGADLSVFTTIKKWDKSVIGSTVTVEIDYLIKSTRSNKIVYHKDATLVCDTSFDSGLSKSSNPYVALFGLIADITVSAVKTAVTEYTDVARSCNFRVFNNDLPKGKYNPLYELDTEQMAEQEIINAQIAK